MKPILFSAPMVQAILAGQKTMTRRVIKPQPSGNLRNSVFVKSGVEDSHGTEIKLPFYRGDVMWVRETWRVGAWDAKQNAICVDYAADGYADSEWKRLLKIGHYDRLSRQSSEDAYAAGIIADENGQYHWERGKGPTRWRPSIFLPREAARIFLRVTEVRAQRLQDITGADVLREGVDNGCSNPTMGARWENMQRDAFRKLWDGLNAARGYGWEENPWVWVYTFERITKEQAEAEDTTNE